MKKKAAARDGSACPEDPGPLHAVIVRGVILIRLRVPLGGHAGLRVGCLKLQVPSCAAHGIPRVCVN